MAKIKVTDNKKHKYNIKLTEVEFNTLYKLLDEMNCADFENIVGEDNADHLGDIWWEMDNLCR